jgi:hypothetical protein
MEEINQLFRAQKGGKISIDDHPIPTAIEEFDPVFEY